MLSLEQKELRRGRFTASRISDLLGIKGLNKTGETYAFDNAIDIVYGIDEEETFLGYDVMRGNELEPFAFAHFADELAKQFIEAYPSKWYSFGENGGATTDGETSNDALIEIKCPKAKKFFRLKIEGISGIDKNYIDQMQMQMLSAEKELTYFRNYIQYNGIEHGLTIEVPRDEERIKLIKDRIDMAVVVRDGFVKKLGEKQAAKAAPDTEKMKAFAESIATLSAPTLQSEKGKKQISEIRVLLNKAWTIANAFKA